MEDSRHSRNTSALEAPYSTRASSDQQQQNAYELSNFSRKIGYHEVNTDEMLDNGSNQHLSRSQTQISRRRWHAYKKFAYRFWLYEIAGCIVALGGLLAIIGVLLKYNGQPLPNWPDLISINSLIAVLTTITKASLMLPVAEGISQLKWQWYTKPRDLSDLDSFDSASRGPWGAFLFLFSFKPHFLATLGAILTIFALAVDPFSQQIIQYKNCLQTNPGLKAEIPIANIISAAVERQGPGSYTLAGYMTVSIYNGLLSPADNVSSLISVSCPSGNCTFPADHGASYSSAAMCSSCQDISQYIINDTVISNVSSTLNFSLPSGARLFDGIALQSIVPDFGVNESWPADYVPQNASTMLFTFESLYYDHSYLVDYSNAKPQAVRCSIYPCLATYGGNISSSILQEHEISTTPMIRDIVGNFALVTNKTLRNGKWEDCNPSPKPSAQNTYPIGTNATFNQTASGSSLSYYPPDCFWGLDSPTVYAIGEVLLPLLYKNNVTSAPGVGTAGDQWMIDQWLGGNATLDTFDAYTQGLAYAMTAAMRENNGRIENLPPTQSYANGTVMQNQTCVEVRWAWLSMPATLILLTILFLFATIARTKVAAMGSRTFSATGPLKSSPLALLFHGMDSSLLRRTGHPDDVSTMEEVARELRVRLGQSPVDGNWYFVGDENKSLIH